MANSGGSYIKDKTGKEELVECTDVEIKKADKDKAAKSETNADSK